MEKRRGDFQSNGNCESPSTTVIQTVAIEKGSDPESLPPLYEAIDPDSLDSLLDSASNGDVEVEFEYAGCHVVVDDAEQVSVTV